MAVAILERSLSAAVLILAIVIIRALALHRLPKLTFLALWAVALCRLLIPFSVPSRFSIYTLADALKNSFPGAGTPMLDLVPIDMGTAAAPINTTLTELTSLSISPFLVIWIIGLSACALFFVGTHLHCLREYKTALPVDNEFVKGWQREHPTRRKVEIRQSDKIAAPLTYGIFRPVILLPKKTDWTDEVRLKIILTHEFVHIRCFDTLTKWLLAAAVCVHWFNPFVWVMHVLANRDIELSCDETVVRIFGETMKSAYALTLIGLEEKRSRLTPLVNSFSKSAIEERIVSIMKIKKTSLMGISLALALVIGTTAVFATNAADAAATNAPIATYIANYDGATENLTTEGNASTTSTGNSSTAQELPQESTTSVAYSSEGMMTPDELAKVYAVYEPFGLTYDKKQDCLYYNGKLVREFIDILSSNAEALDSGKFQGSMRQMSRPEGEIDIKAVRDYTKLDAQGEGKLIGIEVVN